MQGEVRVRNARRSRALLSLTSRFANNEGGVRHY